MTGLELFSCCYIELKSQLMPMRPTPAGRPSTIVLTMLVAAAQPEVFLSTSFSFNTSCSFSSYSQLRVAGLHVTNSSFLNHRPISFLAESTESLP